MMAYRLPRVSFAGLVNPIASHRARSLKRADATQHPPTAPRAAMRRNAMTSDFWYNFIGYIMIWFFAGLIVLVILRVFKNKR